MREGLRPVCATGSATSPKLKQFKKWLNEASSFQTICNISASSCHVDVCGSLQSPTAFVSISATRRHRSDDNVEIDSRARRCFVGPSTPLRAAAATVAMHVVPVHKSVVHIVQKERYYRFVSFYGAVPAFTET